VLKSHSNSGIAPVGNDDKTKIINSTKAPNTYLNLRIGIPPMLALYHLPINKKFLFLKKTTLPKIIKNTYTYSLRNFHFTSLDQVQ